MKNYRTVSWVEYQSRPKDMDFVEFMDKLEKKHKLEQTIEDTKAELENTAGNDKQALMQKIEMLQNNIIRLGI